MQTACRICHQAHGHQLHTAREMMVGTRQTFTYLECGGCGCLQNISVPADLAPFYNADYYSLATEPSPRRDNLAKRWMKTRRTAAWLGHGDRIGAWLLRQFGPPGLDPWARRAGMQQHSSILEIGCGSGDRLRALRDEGFTRLTGADAFIASDIDLGRGTIIRKAAPADIDGCFDFVVLEHAFEHMADQQRTLRTLAALLHPGGTLLISMPLKARAWDLYGVNWVQLDAPRHLFLHTERSFERLVADVPGLRISDVDFDSGAFQFWGSEQYAADIALQDDRSHARNPQRSRFSAADIAGFSARARALNAQRQGDQAVFYLRRDAAH